MQRQSFDVASIAALLRQTEANLSALKPKEDPSLLQPKPAWPTPTQPSVGDVGPASAPMSAYADRAIAGGFPSAGLQAYGAAGASGSGERLELEAQVLQLRGGVDRLERRLEEELRAFLGVCDKRMQAREEQLRSIGESLQVSANNVAENLCHRVDARLRELERTAADKGDRALEEVWESLRRIQADGRAFEGRIQRCAQTDDFADRLRESERTQLQRIDEKLAAMERRAVEHRAQLDSGTEAWREAVNQRCHALETRVWEQQAERGDLADAVLKRLPEAVPLRELQEELRTHAYSVEVQQRRLSACEAKISKLPALEAKVEFSETQTAQQVEEQAQTARGLSDVAQRLSQKLSNTEATCQRVEAQSAALEARLRGQGDEERERMTAELEALQQRMLQRLDDVESRLQRGAARTEREVAQQIATVMQRLSDDTAASRQQMEGMLREVEVRGESTEDAFRQQLERTANDLRGEARGLREHVERRHAELDGTCRATDERHRAHAMTLSAESDNFKSQLETLQTRLSEHRTEARGFHERADRKHAEMDANLKVIDEQHRSHVVAWGTDSDSAKKRLEALQTRLAELEAGMGRTGKAHESLRGALSGIEEQVKARTSELANDSEALTGRVEHLDSRLQELELAAARAARGRDWNADADKIKARLDALQALASESTTVSEEMRRRSDNVQARISDLESGTARATGTLEGIRGNVAVFEEKLKSRTLEWAAESEAVKSRVDNLQAQLVEAQVGLARAQTGVDGLRGNVSGLDGLRASLAGVEGGLTALDEQHRARAHELSTGHETTRAGVETAQARIGDVQQSMQRMQTSVETLRSSVLNLEAQNESMRSNAANQEVVIQSLHTSFREREGLDDSVVSEGRAEGRGGSIVEKLAVQQLIAASEARMLERSSKAANELRTEVVELKVQLAQASETPGSWLEAAAAAEARATIVQDSVAQLRNEMASLRSDVRSATMRAADQVASVAALQEGVTTLKASGGETAASISEQAVRLTSVQERLREVEDVARATQSSQREVGSEQGVKFKTLQEKMQSLEEATQSLQTLQKSRSQAICQPLSSSPPPPGRRQLDMQSANASVASDGSSGAAAQGFEQRLHRLEQKVDACLPNVELEERLARLEAQLKGGSGSGPGAAQEGDAGRGAAGTDPDLEEPLTILEARLSRIEDHIQSAEIEDFNLVSSCSAGADSPSTWSPPVNAEDAGPPQPSVVLRLSWSGEPPQLLESDASTGLISALRSALTAAPPAAAADMHVVRADLREEPGSGAPCGAVCLVSTADARAAEAELRRQLRDPGSAIRRMIPSLVVEDSSAVARQPMSSVMMTQRSVMTRVDDLERSRELLAESLGEVERRMLHVERLAAGGALGMDLGAPSAGNSGAPLLGDLSELGESVQEESTRAVPLPLSDGSALAPGSVVRTRRGGESRDEDESSNEFDFEASSPAGDKADLSSLQLWEAEQAAAKAKQEKRRRAREEAAAAQEEEQRKAEEELRRAEEERRRVEEEQRQAEEEAVRLRAEEERRHNRCMDAWARLAVEVHQRQIEAEIAARGVAKCAEEEAEQARRAQHEQAEKLAKLEARRRRVVGLPVVARRGMKVPEADVRAAFDYADIGGRGYIVHEDLRSFLADHLGFGQAEVASFHDLHSSAEGDDASRVVTFAGFSAGYGHLDPFRIEKRRGEVVVRKPGSLDKQAAYIEDVEDSEVYICDPTAQAFIDDCKRSLVLLGPCESSAFVRNCEDCTFWLAVQQLRTRDCRRCTFYLYSKTEPIIEASDELSFAPWAAVYPKCTAQFSDAGFDPERNRWNAIYDFSGSQDRSHWRIVPLGEVAELEVELSEPAESSAAADSPGPAVTHAVLCAEPLEPEESCGESLGSIPQTRPSVPLAPAPGVTTTKIRFQDETHARPTLSKALPRQAPKIFQAVAASTASSPTAAATLRAGIPVAAAASDTPGSPVGAKGRPEDMPEASPPGGVPASSLGDLSGTSALQEGLEPAFSDDESIGESMELPLSPDASPLQGRQELSPTAQGSAPQVAKVGASAAHGVADAARGAVHGVEAAAEGVAHATSGLFHHEKKGSAHDLADASAEHRLSRTTEEHISALQAELQEATDDEPQQAVASTESQPDVHAEDSRHEGVLSGAMHWVKDHMPGHPSKPAEGIHQIGGLEQAQQQALASDEARTPRVQGGMDAGDDSDGSSDDVPPPVSARGAADTTAPPADGSDGSGGGDIGRAPSAAAPTARLDKRAAFGEDSSDEDEEEEKVVQHAPTPSPKASPTPAVDRRKMFGEDSSDDEEIERAAAPVPKAALPKAAAMKGSLTHQLRPTAKSPMSHGAKLARGGLDEDSDNEDDIEEAVSSWSAAAPTKSPSGLNRGSPSVGRGKSLSGGIGLNASRDSAEERSADSSLLARAAGAAVKVGIGGAPAHRDTAETDPVEVPLASSAGADKSGASAGAASAGLGLSGNSWDDEAAESSFGDISAGAEAALGLRSPTAAETTSHEAPATDQTAAEAASANSRPATAAAMWSGIAEAVAEHHLPTTEEAAAGSAGDDSVPEDLSDEEFEDGSDIDLP